MKAVAITPLTKVNWSNKNKGIFSDVMQITQKGGCFSDSGFKKSQWTEIVEAFYVRTGLRYTRQQLQNCYAELKKKYGIFSILKDNSG